MDQHLPIPTGASYNDESLLPAPDTQATNQSTLGELRKATISALSRVIYGTWKGKPLEGEQSLDRTFSLEHDPQVRRRSEAIELLGQFSERDAANNLRAVLLRGEKEIDTPPGVRHWLRDTALLTLLRPNKLPSGAVEAALWDEYAYLRHPWPWQWPAVYADLPLLRHYGRLRVFFLSFWLWPILLLAPAPLGFALQLVIATSRANELEAFGRVIEPLERACDANPDACKALEQMLEQAPEPSNALSIGLAGIGALIGLYALVQLVRYLLKRRSTVAGEPGPRVTHWHIPAVLAFVLVALALLVYPLTTLPATQQNILAPLNGWVLIFGIALETYLIHQIAIALLVARIGPLLRIPTNRPMPTVGAWLSAVLALLVLALLTVLWQTMQSGCWQVSENGGSECGSTLFGGALLLPLVLLPLYMLAHDLEQFVRYSKSDHHLLRRILNLFRGGSGGTNARLTLWAIILRRLTDVIYLLLLPLIIMSFWALGQARWPLLLTYLAYLFATPLLVAGVLRLLSILLEKIFGRSEGGSRA